MSQVQKLTAGRYRGKKWDKPEGLLESHNVVEELCRSWMVIFVKTQCYYLAKEDCRVFYFIGFVWGKKGSFEVCMSARV